MEHSLNVTKENRKRYKKIKNDNDINLEPWDPYLLPRYNYLIPIAQIYSKIKMGLDSQNNFMQNLWMNQNKDMKLKTLPKIPIEPIEPKKTIKIITEKEYIDLKNVIEMYNNVIDILNETNIYGDLIKYNNELNGIYNKNQLIPVKISKIKLSNYIFPADDNTLELINYINDCIVFIIKVIDYITTPIMK